MRKGSSLGRKSNCHPDRPHFSKGKCFECYRREYDHNKYLENKEEVKARTSKYAKDHPERFNEWSRKYRLANPEKVTQRHKKYNMENAEKISLQKKEYREKNYEKISKRGHNYYISNPEKERAKRLKKYGMTIENYESMFSVQSGLCAICESDNNGKRLHIDHDHETRKVRQLLCNSCNIGLGMLKDNPDIVEKAMNYLRKHKI